MKAEFFILGALHRANLHPYEIKRRLTNALVECYTDVDVGTLYYAVRQLAKSGDIAPRRSEKVARGGERTVYRITPKGKKRFQKLLLERFREKGSVAQTIYPALLFLHLAHLPAVAGLLRERLQQTESALTEVRTMKDQPGAVLAILIVQVLQRIPAVGHGVGLKSFERQQLRHHLPEIGVVFHDEDGSLARVGVDGVDFVALNWHAL